MGGDHLQSLFLLQLEQAQGSSPQSPSCSRVLFENTEYANILFFWCLLKGTAVTGAAQARGAASADTVCEMEYSLL